MDAPNFLGTSSPWGRSRTHLTVEHHKDHCLIHLELTVDDVI